MKLFYVAIVLILLAGCQNSHKTTSKENDTFSFYVGTYNTDESKGIYRYQLGSDGSLIRVGLAAVSDNPSFLAMSADKRFLVATNETNIEGTGTIESFFITGDSLEFISKSPSGGAHPCYISVNENGFVLTANYTGGNVGLLKLNNKGILTDLLDVQQHEGKGTTDRQQAPHAHSAWFNPVGKGIIAIDLGTNELWFSHLDTDLQKLIPSDPSKIKMNPGAGPRHLTFHPNGKWIYVVNELDNTVTLLQKNNLGMYKKGESFTTLPTGFTEPSYTADIHISADGKFIYVSNRGHNSIAIFEIDDQNGLLNPIGYESTHGEWPRNFSLSPDENYLLVANQHTQNIVSFKRDKTSGLLKYTAEIDAPTPVCILF